MVTSPAFAFCLTCLFMGKIAQVANLMQSTTVHQESGFISATVGDNLILKCFFTSDAARYYWYKQTMGQKPRSISITSKFDKNGTFYDEFKNDPRFTLETNIGRNHLMISDLHISDSATYYCASGYSLVLEFAKGTTVNVKGSGLNTQTWVHQSTSESIQPGGSVTLNCVSVHAGTCDDGEHSVYWFKYSEESHPGLIYTHGGRNDQCQRNTSTQTNTCVYNLPIKSLNLSHAGTYYCAVASCGQILFGNGTKLDVEHVSFVLVYFLSGALAITIILCVILAILAFKIGKRPNCQCTECQARVSAASTSTEGYQDADSLHYAALSVNGANRRRKQDQTFSECVYSSVKQYN
ncbi:uncharacterized protein LOC128383431 [Scomber japonicus]|uniref:uncharacterized protein LOC128383431 n=1 Tax=Scomber japonicus TaxID=13676 RepID=UPI002305C252|nr:uncharacterized protein LOC128383431 [Scomber japonicus]